MRSGGVLQFVPKHLPTSVSSGGRYADAGGFEGGADSAGEARGAWGVAVDAQRVGTHRDHDRPVQARHTPLSDDTDSTRSNEGGIVKGGALHVPRRERAIGKIGTIG